MKIEKARINDAIQIHRLINHFADRDEMLPRPLSEIYENIRDYFVVRDQIRVVACAALHISWADLAEVKSVAVAEDSQKQGLGAQLITTCLKEARQLEIPKVFCLTYHSRFFAKFGFSEIDKAQLPRKI